MNSVTFLCDPFSISSHGEKKFHWGQILPRLDWRWILISLALKKPLGTLADSIFCSEPSEVPVGESCSPPSVVSLCSRIMESLEQAMWFSK